jgi:flavorubredoxin
METQIDEVAPDIFRLSTVVPDAPVIFNQYVVRAEQPLLFHTGGRFLFPLVSEAVNRIVPLDRLRWIAFGHVESDENGAMNQFLAAAPHAQVAHGAIACMVQVNDLADREPYPLAPDEVIDLGGKRIRNIDTPHLPHGWDAHVLYEETTGTLLSGDLFTQFGSEFPVTTTDDIVPTALQGEDFGQPTALTPTTGARIRALAQLNPQRIALMHGPVFDGDAASALIRLGDGYDALFAEQMARA